MSIKDRIAAAQAKQEAGEDEPLDDLSDLELEFGAAGEDDQDDQDAAEPTPAWEEVPEEPSDEELEPSAELGDQAVSGGGDGPPVDVAAPAPSESDDGEPPVSGPTPSLDALRGLGFSVEGLTEAQATVRLASEFSNLAKSYREAQPYIQAGREVAPHWDSFTKFRQSGTAQPPAASDKQEPPKAADIAEVLSKLGESQSEPEFNPAWRSHLLTREISFDGEYYVPAPNATPRIQAIVDKMNAHRDWEIQAQAQVQRLPEVVRSLASLVTDQRGGLSMEQVEQNLRIKQAQEEDARFAKGVLDRNKSWMFETDSRGSVLTHPIHNTPILTALGMRYYNELTSLDRAGIKDSKLAHYYAMSALGMDVKADPKSVAPASGKPQTPPTDGAGGSASSAAGTPSGTARAAAAGSKTPASSSAADKRVELLKAQRQRASRSANVVSSGQTATTDAGEPHVNSRPKLGDMLEDAFVKAGLKPSKRKPAEDDDE